MSWSAALNRLVWWSVPTPGQTTTGPGGRCDHSLLTVALIREGAPAQPIALIRQWSYAPGQVTSAGRLWPDPLITEVCASPIDRSKLWMPFEYRPRHTVEVGKGQALLLEYDPTPAVIYAARIVSAPPAWVGDRYVRDGQVVGVAKRIMSGPRLETVGLWRGSLDHQLGRAAPVERRWEGSTIEAEVWVESCDTLGRVPDGVDVAARVAALQRAERHLQEDVMVSALRDAHIPEGAITVLTGRQWAGVHANRRVEAERAGLRESVTLLPAPGGSYAVHLDEVTKKPTGAVTFVGVGAIYAMDASEISQAAYDYAGTKSGDTLGRAAAATRGREPPLAAPATIGALRDLSTIGTPGHEDLSTEPIEVTEAQVIMPLPSQPQSPSVPQMGL